MRSIIRTIILVGLSIALLAFVFSRADPKMVVEALLSVEPNLLVFGLLLMSLSYPFRAQRWRYLLRPVELVGFNSSFRATTIGFAINALLPGRVGELVRPLVLARREKLSASSAFATERSCSLMRSSPLTRHASGLPRTIALGSLLPAMTSRS